MGKKTFMLGRVFYEIYTNCVQINSFNELYEKITNEIDNIIEVDLVKYIQAYHNWAYKSIAVYQEGVNYEFVEEYLIK